MRAPRTVLGGRLALDGATVTLVLIGVNVAVFLVGLVVPDLDQRFDNLALALTPSMTVVGVAKGQYYRLLTSAFLHAGLLHILFNMFALVQIGPVLERSLGRARYLALYLLSALAGSVSAFVLAPPNQPSVGASGAIFGLFGAYYVVVRRIGGQTGPIVVLLMVNLVITFSVPGIDWRAHLGGLAAGGALGAAFAYLPRGPRQRMAQVGACAVLAAGLAVAVVLRAAALNS